MLYIHPKREISSIRNKIKAILTSDGDPLISRKRILIHISQGLDSISIHMKHFLFLLKISKTFVFLLRTSGEYLKRYGQGSVFKTDVFMKKTNVYIILMKTKNVLQTLI